MIDTFLLQFSTGIRLVALAVFLSTVLPIQYREYRLGNGLKFYRMLLFILGLTFVASMVLPFILTALTITKPDLIARSFMSVINAFGDIVTVLIFYLLYNKGGDRH